LRSDRVHRRETPLDGKAEPKAAAAKRSWDELRNFFAGKTIGARYTIEEINDAVAEPQAVAGPADE
jgi:hypothetical protein